MRIEAKQITQATTADSEGPQKATNVSRGDALVSVMGRDAIQSGNFINKKSRIDFKAILKGRPMDIALQALLLKASQ